MEPIRELGPMAVLSGLVGLLPLAMGVMYALWPSEQRLSLVRTLSAATVFSALSGTMLGFLNGLAYIARKQPAGLTPPLAAGFSESLIPVFFGFGCLTVTWLCVTIGLWRRTGAE